MQADIFSNYTSPIKQFAGKDKEALEQMERAINLKTASKEEEAEASAPLDEQEAPPQEQAPKKKNLKKKNKNSKEDS